MRLAKALDERGEKTPSGGQWHYGKGGPIGLTRFIKAHMPEGLLVTQQSTVAHGGACLTIEHKGTQASLSYDSTQQSTEDDIGAQKHTDLTVSQEHTGEYDMGCETPAHESTHESVAHSSIREHTEESVPQPYDIDTQADAPHTSAHRTTEIVESEPVPQESTESHEPSCEMPAHNVIQMSEKDAFDLRELLVWWRERRDQLDTMSVAREERPAFKGPRNTTKTVRLSEAMARAAEKYAARHRAQTGGTFSGLCEWLIWQALGRPETFVIQENTE